MTFNELKEKDYIASAKWEKILKNDIEKFYNIDLIETDRYHVFDYIDKDVNIYIELKTRTCKSNKYPDLMMGNNKIKCADEYLKNNKKIYFVFYFTNGLYYIDYNENTEYTIRRGGRNDRGVNEYKDFVYFPQKYLIKMS